MHRGRTRVMVSKWAGARVKEMWAGQGQSLRCGQTRVDRTRARLVQEAEMARKMVQAGLAPNQDSARAVQFTYT